jgi:hypothetical protein
VEFEGVSFANANLPLPTPAPLRHIYDSEAQVLAYGVSVVTSPATEQSTDDTVTTVEPITGAELRVPR